MAIMLLNEKLNDTAYKIMWAYNVHMCERVRRSMDTTGSTNSPFEILYGDKPSLDVLPTSQIGIN